MKNDMMINFLSFQFFMQYYQVFEIHGQIEGIHH